MTKATVLLTGATGFLGSNLLKALLDQEYKVVILKRSTSDIWRIKQYMDRVVSYNIDIDPISLAFEQQRIDCVIHTACHYGRNGDSLHLIVESNLMFGLKVLDAAIAHNVNTFINTDSMLPRELNAYSLSKKQLVDWLKQQSEKIQVINLKLEHMYGPKDDTTKFVPWVVSQLRQNKIEIKLTKGEQQRDFIYIDDVVSAFLTVFDNIRSLGQFSEFDVGTGKLISVKSFLLQLKQAYEDSFGASPTTLAFGLLPYRDGEMMTVEVNNQALISLGWSPKICLKQGIENSLKESI
ncbi:NAD-dependent epimerase/dehydratase family protein [Rheinheimera sediminis]|uniref:NAD-dependent epimerase/dehydratase family protein n=1 Tax=Rheinheimera sp. YQF-1 TaxID=2499626 RepID=UPI000FDC8468|nr:NAD-dependent epimerase/dehydratase [Rheinheimera sp. YQF-1]RVT46919.1 NAD-dependent epimerase/dehydratase family protein [Rheinheimera sp. YQF-1]